MPVTHRRWAAIDVTPGGEAAFHRRRRPFGTVWSGALLAGLAFLNGVAVWWAPYGYADNYRLNDGVVANVYMVQHNAGCRTELRINAQLRLAAQWHTDDALNNRNLYGDRGSDGSTAQDRAAAAGFHGRVAETIAINPALAISGIELINQWYYNPGYLAIMQDCANSEIGVWSESNRDRTVVVAVYGRPE